MILELNYVHFRLFLYDKSFMFWQKTNLRFFESKFWHVVTAAALFEFFKINQKEPRTTFTPKFTCHAS